MNKALLRAETTKACQLRNRSAGQLRGDIRRVITEVVMKLSLSLRVVVLGVGLLVAACDSGKVGTLDQIKKSGEIRLGYRTDAPPLSFNDTAGQAAGYSVELCKRIAAAVKDHLKLTDL